MPKTLLEKLEISRGGQQDAEVAVRTYLATGVGAARPMHAHGLWDV